MFIKHFLHKGIGKICLIYKAVSLWHLFFCTIACIVLTQALCFLPFRHPWMALSSKERMNTTSLVNFFPLYPEKTLRPVFSTNFKNINSLTREVAGVLYAISKLFGSKIDTSEVVNTSGNLALRDTLWLCTVLCNIWGCRDFVGEVNKCLSKSSVRSELKLSWYYLK